MFLRSLVKFCKEKQIKIYKILPLLPKWEKFHKFQEVIKNVNKNYNRYSFSLPAFISQILNFIEELVNE